jgi:hypothetical protein
MNFIKTNFLSLIILLLIVLLFIGRCSKPNVIEKPIIVRDTIWVEKAGGGQSVPHLTHSIPLGYNQIFKETKYLPDTNYQKLLVQYRDLLELYFSKNVLNDRLKIDSIGYVDVTDTVTKNLISNRTFKYNLKYPVIKETIIIPPKRINQLYIGGGIEGNATSLVHQINAGLLLKNKKDQIYGVYTGINMQGQMQFGIQSYWKISFGK